MTNNARIRETTGWLNRNRVMYDVNGDGVRARGLLRVPAGKTVSLPALTELTGRVRIDAGGSLCAPALMEAGSISIDDGGSMTADALTTVDNASLRGRLNARALAKVSVHLELIGRCVLAAPAAVEACALSLREGCDTTVPALVTAEAVHVHMDCRLIAPALEAAEKVVIHRGGRMEAPALVQVGSIHGDAVSDLTAPALRAIGHVAADTSMRGYKITVFNGIGCVVLSEKTRGDITIRRCREAKFADGELVGGRIYVASRGGYNAHGDTVAAALAGLAFEAAGRDLAYYQSMPLDAELSPHKWAAIYHIATGAPEMGVRDFLRRLGTLKIFYSLNEVLDLTRGAYGAARFRRTIRP